MTKDIKLIIHWTAGTNKANSLDKQHYHAMVEGDGNIVYGNNTLADNYNCYDGKYAAHSGGYNTNTYGFSFCGMADFKNSKSVGKYPITAIQFEKGCEQIAKIIKQYNIPLNSDYVMTHYELGIKSAKLKSTHPLMASNIGKIDIIYIPSYPDVKTTDVGNFIRNKVKWYLSKIK